MKMAQFSSYENRAYIFNFLGHYHFLLTCILKPYSSFAQLRHRATAFFQPAICFCD